MAFRKTPQQKLDALKEKRAKIDQDIAATEQQIRDAAVTPPSGGGTGAGSSPPRTRPVSA